MSSNSTILTVVSEKACLPILFALPTSMYSIALPFWNAYSPIESVSVITTPATVLEFANALSPILFTFSSIAIYLIPVVLPS